MKAYQIKITLLETNPVIWRRVIMPADVTFNRLHDIIQNTTNFQSGYPSDHCHLFEFDLRQDNLVVTNDLETYEENKFYKKQYKKAAPGREEDPFGVIANHLKMTIRQPRIKLDKYIEKFGQFIYTYDFGDNWQFEILLEEVVEDYHYGYPTLISGQGTAPPEDVGGVERFNRFLMIYHDPAHEGHREVREWAESQGYREYDEEWINRRLKPLKYKKTEWDKLQ
ncbi:plasmid pRiA4b ORF-3 family protein [Sediminibacillus massiliensis]|uniref:plasmid pRiA4b ORF-3 family protein n=1 Tax=Sediminibacillus massiliensis TaxID=1926277 RepID=UPI000988562F|nr:plasmid pRiA4b ORF-3 family protein [Sediminibacillus massiliensis]